MTTVATDGKSIAADGLASVMDRVTNTASVKIRRLSDGRLAGYAGTVEDGLRFFAWLESGGKAPKLDSSFQGLVLHSGGEVHYWAGPCEDSGPQMAPAAIGSGGDIAIGAMLAGKSPAKAVAIAAQRCIHTGGKITVLSL